ncbi:MAG: four helix bundle protein [bacterium]|nr:MAG: four helix bundle protein [bacterium]
MQKDFRKSRVWNLSRNLLLVIFKISEDKLDNLNSSLVRKIQKSSIEILINIEKTMTHYRKNDYLKYFTRSLLATISVEKNLREAQKKRLFQKSDTEQILKKIIEIRYLLVSLVMKPKGKRIRCPSHTLNKIPGTLCLVL